MQIDINIKQQGFSLVEMAIVLIILGFVLGALLLPLQAQRSQLAQSQTENTLELAKKALLGYAQAHGRLPCPATAASNGAEAPRGGGSCTQQLGLLPAATLGITSVDKDGNAIDAWNNPIRYAISQDTVDPIAQSSVANNVFSSSNGMSNAGVANLSPSLRVCRQPSASTLTCSMPITATNYETNYLINNAVVVIYSLGPTAAQGSGGVDEAENLNADSVSSPPNVIDRVFVSHEPRSAADPNGEFDHIVTWISPYVLYNAMIEAGQLH